MSKSFTKAVFKACCNLKCHVRNTKRIQNEIKIYFTTSSSHVRLETVPYRQTRDAKNFVFHRLVSLLCSYLRRLLASVATRIETYVVSFFSSSKFERLVRNEWSVLSQNTRCLYYLSKGFSAHPVCGMPLTYLSIMCCIRCERWDENGVLHDVENICVPR